MAARIVRDRLYSIFARPQELALYGERVRIELQYAPMCEAGDPPTREHFRLLVCEVSADLPPDDELRRAAGERIQLLKCGWEIELATDEPVEPAQLAEQPEEMPLLLRRIADTVNDLARRGGLEAPFGPDLVARLLADYRARSTAAGR